MFTKLNFLVLCFLISFIKSDEPSSKVDGGTPDGSDIITNSSKLPASNTTTKLKSRSTSSNPEKVQPDRKTKAHTTTVNSSTILEQTKSIDSKDNSQNVTLASNKSTEDSPKKSDESANTGKTGGKLKKSDKSKPVSKENSEHTSDENPKKSEDSKTTTKIRPNESPTETSTKQKETTTETKPQSEANTPEQQAKSTDSKEQQAKSIESKEQQAKSIESKESGGEKPKNNKLNEKEYLKKKIHVQNIEEGSNSHFMVIIFLGLLFTITSYVVFQKRKKIMAYVIEGRRRNSRDRRTSGNKEIKVSYKPLETEDKEAGINNYKYVY